MRNKKNINNEIVLQITPDGDVSFFSNVK